MEVMEVVRVVWSPHHIININVVNTVSIILAMVHSNVQPEIGYKMLDKRTYYGRHGKGVPREFLTTGLWWVRGSGWRWEAEKTSGPSESFTPAVCIQALYDSPWPG